MVGSWGGVFNQILVFRHDTEVRICVSRPAPDIGTGKGSLAEVNGKMFLLVMVVLQKSQNEIYQFFYSSFIKRQKNLRRFPVEN